MPAIRPVAQVITAHQQREGAGFIVRRPFPTDGLDQIDPFLMLRKPVVPGDRLHIHVTKIRRRGAVWKFQGEARVDGVLMAQARFTAMIMDD